MVTDSVPQASQAVMMTSGRPPYKSARLWGALYCHTKIPPSIPTVTTAFLSGVTATRVIDPLWAIPMK
eukprot:1160455-Pelagomonas_calceolata.AAC.2